MSDPGSGNQLMVQGAAFGVLPSGNGSLQQYKGTVERPSMQKVQCKLIHKKHPQETQGLNFAGTYVCSLLSFRSGLLDAWKLFLCML